MKLSRYKHFFSVSWLSVRSPFVRRVGVNLGMREELEDIVISRIMHKPKLNKLSVDGYLIDNYYNDQIIIE